jgi:dipeptidyl-peptidase-4
MPHHHRPLFAILALCLASVTPLAHGQGTATDYERASKLPALTQKKVFKERVTPHWLADNRRFWYRNDLADGEREFILVDAVKGERRLAFDHARLAAALAKESDKEQRGTHLAIEALDFSEDGRLLRFRSGDKRWKCDLQSYTLSQDESPAPPPPAEKQERDTPPRRQRGERPSANSPDAKWTAFLKDHNLYLRERDGGKEFALSKEGNADDAYTARVSWSPDSKKLVVMRTKKAQEHKVYLIDSSPRSQLQPKLVALDYLKPGDNIAIPKPHLFDVESRK